MPLLVSVGRRTRSGVVLVAMVGVVTGVVQVLIGWMSSSAPPVLQAAPPTHLIPATAAQDAFSRPAQVLVLGDSTSDEPGEWVGLWARSMSRDRPVQVHWWDRAAQRFFEPPSLGLASGRGQPPVEIWNLSADDTRATYPLREHRLRAVKSEPDLVILNYGLRQSVGDIEAALSEVTARVTARWPTAVMLVTRQNPIRGPRADEHEATMTTLQVWAIDNGVSGIDVWHAFQGRRLDHLLTDDTLPSARGYQLWARTVAKGLGTD